MTTTWRRDRYTTGGGAARIALIALSRAKLPDPLPVSRRRHGMPEDGDGPGSRISRMMPIVKEHGAAVVALTIDEQGMANQIGAAIENARLVQRDLRRQRARITLQQMIHNDHNCRTDQRQHEPDRISLPQHHANR